MLYASFREKQITEIMKDNGIYSIQDLHPENICEVFKIDLVYHSRKSNCFNEDGYSMIYIDNRLPYLEQRYKFYHEFAHCIYHIGDQEQLSQGINELQEIQANWIALYASMPRHIFEPMAIKHQSVEKLQELFEIPAQYIIKRFNVIKRERSRQNFQYRMKAKELNQRRKSLQPGKVYESTISVLKQLEKQVGEENINHEVKRLLR